MNTGISSPRCVTLGDDDALNAGGKAAGLTRLINAGLRVPEGFVVMGADPGALPPELPERYRAMGGGAVAVRSSATGEDGADFSHAGQYETFLDITGIDSLADAVTRCMNSLQGERSRGYRSLFDGGFPESMSVVVQRLVRASRSGVLFTADPLGGSGDLITINAVRGLGEALVSGTARSDQYLYTPDGTLQQEILQGDLPVLEAGECRLLVEEALAAERHFGHPLDMEWAFDGEGVLYWLQARPITTADEAGIDELDTPVPSDDTVFTRCNIGEMLPGAVTPLSISIFAEAIDFGMRDMYRYAGAITKRESDRFICSYSNHLFMNFSLMHTITGCVWGSSRDALNLSILGRAKGEAIEVPRKPLPVRLLNSIKYFHYVSRWKGRIRELERTAVGFRIDVDRDDPAAIYRDIHSNIPLLFRQYINHYITSAYSGVMNGILMAVLAEGGKPVLEHHERAASLLVNIEGIESADVVTSMKRMASVIAGYGAAAARFASMEPALALRWISESGQEAVGFDKFLKRHGHRCIREAELREREWADDPEGLVETIQSMVRAKLAGTGSVGDDGRENGGDAPLPESRAFRWALKKARSGVGAREYSKALVIRVQHQIKIAYRRMGTLLAERGAIPDGDLVYFFTHQELGRLLQGERPLVKRAMKRRRLLPEQMALYFPDICRGRPVPVTPGSGVEGDGTVFRGIPVSRGMAEGSARVVLTQEDARSLQPGEIMVARFTDIGWTPFYGMAAGLVTEIGSALSHGAVVAREYGLPMVVNVAGATARIVTGERLRLNAYEGTLVKL
ncbi:MAG: hypothetical protein JXA20_08130 [Spirochaetes bacterium]|nr:hypothetical protein [Spirochaetota bacterium]